MWDTLYMVKWSKQNTGQAKDDLDMYPTHLSGGNAQLLENSQLTLMDEMERLMCNFHYLGYYCSPNLSIHQNSSQELTWNFLVTLGGMVYNYLNDLSITYCGGKIGPDT